jgi:DNA repair and recombination protein RAD54B
MKPVSAARNAPNVPAPQEVVLMPRFDTNAPNALILPRPTPAQLQAMGLPKNAPVVDVVVDPYLSHHLRPHQREGVRFLYECLTGLREYAGNGAILADDMGLGKTLQTITLLWTLLKQSFTGKPVCARAIIVCPSSLVKNWRSEFKKWLGQERLQVFTIGEGKTLQHFAATTVYPVRCRHPTHKTASLTYTRTLSHSRP